MAAHMDGNISGCHCGQKWGGEEKKRRIREAALEEGTLQLERPEGAPEL